MNGLEKIIQRIKEQAEKKKETILSEAKEKAKEKENEAKREAEKEKERIIEEGEREAKQIRRRKLASARKKARQNKLEAREEIIQKVLKEARKDLAELRENNERYNKILKNLIEAGGIAVGGGDLEVSVLRNDKKMLSKSEIREISESITKETGEETSLEVLANLQKADGGTIVQKSDGSITCDNTFEARLKRMKSSLRQKIAGILFEN